MTRGWQVALTAVATVHAVFSTWALSGCDSSSEGQASSTTGQVTSLDPEADLIDAMIARESIANRAGDLTIEDLFAKAGGVDSFRAEVVQVGVGKAFNDVMTDNDPRAEEVPFDDSKADWRTFHVQVRVLEVFVGDETPTSEVTLGLAFGRDLGVEIVRGGLLSMQEIVVFTDADNDVFSYDPTVQAVLYDGAFLSPVDGGTVPFPVLSTDGRSTKLVDAIDSLAELRAAHEHPASAEASLA
jgi:hypothetical protein